MTIANSKVTDPPPEVVVVILKAVLYEGNFAELFPAVCEDSLVLSLCPASRVKDPSKGFFEKKSLKDLIKTRRSLEESSEGLVAEWDFFEDFFRVRAEIRLKLQDNERWTASVKRKTVTCTVCSILL